MRMQLVDESWKGCLAVVVRLFRGEAGTDVLGLKLTGGNWDGVYRFLDRNGVQGDGGRMGDRMLDRMLVRFLEVMA